ncbi:protein Z, vitamin K-dependent plasma glycoprotein b isoform X2 [Tachysurus vachellii]|uniref:protein Z, vitamin K-dependent plasma glycoprotein b isoform X2 n=1 Tax=Tachysurus vachellii TaxID=175792 RepID=UPI00296B3C1B|nr:protein Z, vitamin K-dependent plasma glycoprotein b isoform X2 [Tachysurus vachellii]
MRKDATRRKPERSLRTIRKQKNSGPNTTFKISVKAILVNMVVSVKRREEDTSASAPTCTQAITVKMMFLNALLEALWFVNTTADPYMNHTDASAPEATNFTPMAGAAPLRVCDTYSLLGFRSQQADIISQDTCGYLRVLSEDSTKKNTNQNDRICPQGKCPWQVTFVDVGGDVICQGVILGKRSILTTATCMTTGKELSLVIGHSVEKINASQVTKRTLHDRYLTSRPDDDLAFLELKEPITLGLVAIHLCLPEKDFSENILMKSDKEGVVMGGENKPLYLSLDVCNSKLNLSFPLTNKMFCMEERKAEGSVQGRLKQEKKECDLPSGSPVATVEGNTAFLTGLFLSQSDCSQGLVFTKVSRYLPWIRRLLVSTEAVHT